MERMCVCCGGAFPKQGAEGGAQRRGAGYGQQSWNWTSSGVEQPHKAGLSHGLSPAVICGCHSCSAVDSGMPPTPFPAIQAVSSTRGACHLSAPGLRVILRGSLPAWLCGPRDA